MAENQRLANTWSYKDGKIVLRANEQRLAEVRELLLTIRFDALEIVEGSSDLSYLFPFAEKIQWLHSSFLNSQSELERLSYIERVTLAKISKEFPFDFRLLPRLKVLTCDEAASIPHQFINHKNIEVLVLQGLKAKDLTFLTEASKLKAMKLVSTPLKTLDGLNDHPHLIELRLSYSRALTDISALQHANQLQALEFEATPNIADISSIYGLSKLRWLFVESKRAKQKNFEWLRDMPALECANIMVETEIINWDIFAKHPRLYDVAFYTNPDYVMENEGEILRKLSMHGRKVKSLKYFPKGQLPAVSIEFIPPPNIEKPLPRHVYQNHLKLAEI